MQDIRTKWWFKTGALIVLFAVVLSFVLIISSRGGSYVEIDGRRIIVEVASTPEEKQKGLMYREYLCENCGMLFVFEEEDIMAFWMKNTIIPLDMTFINSEFEVVDVLSAEPCVDDSCERYVSKDRALYVLETNAGMFDGDIVGEKVKIRIK